MHYDFDQVISRVGTSCEKWDSKEEYRTGKVIPMWVADMDFQIAEPILERLRKRLEHPVMGYVHREEDYSEITADWVKKRHDWEIETSWVTFCPGIVPAISAAIQALTKPGETVMLQSPVYYPFKNTILACGRKIVDNPLLCVNGHYEMDYRDMEKKIQKENVKLLLLCNPHNPVGRVYTREELTHLGEICERNQVLIFSDEIHSDLILNGHKHVPIASLSSPISRITMTGIAPSKTFNLAGLQAASVICENKKMLESFEAVIQMNAVHFPNIFGLEAYKAAYTKGEEYLEQLLTYLENNLNYCKEFFKDRLAPLKLTELEGTYLLWIDCRELGLTQCELETFMEERAHIALDSGTWFGEMGNGYMRMNIACPRTILEQALEQLETALSNKQ